MLRSLAGARLSAYRACAISHLLDPTEVLIVTGDMFVKGEMRTISNWLLETFPVFAGIG